jgi:hypothetical protein
VLIVEGGIHEREGHRMQPTQGRSESRRERADAAREATYELSMIAPAGPI